MKLKSVYMVTDMEGCAGVDEWDPRHRDDAAQARGKVPIDVNAMNIDAMSLSGHKVCAPHSSAPHIPTL